jgi:hypothetical protein
MALSGSESDNYKKMFEQMAKFYANNERSDLLLEVWSRLFPLVLSSLITVYSIISASLFYGLSYLIYISSIVLIILIVITLYSIPFMVLLNTLILKGLKVSRSATWSDTSENKLIIRTSYSSVFEKNYRQAIKKTMDDQLSTAFVIFFPGGIADILLGIVGNMPSIGINTNNQIITGIAFLSISIILLIFTVRRYVSNVKERKNIETSKMSQLLEIIQVELEKWPCLEVRLNKGEYQIIRCLEKNAG